ncbi:MAG: ATP-dependent DNA helicase RecG [Synergistaceae bacterium]|nr:ATP-dependent DNA helicase RecG [Synergistaceae bacterium]
MKETPGLESSILTLKGVGKTRERILRSLGVSTLRDLFLYFPKRYEDRRRIVSIHELEKGKPALLVGTLTSLEFSRGVRHGKGGVRSVLSAVFEDHGETLLVKWFNASGVVSRLFEGTRISIYGRPEKGRGGWEMTNPGFEILENEAFQETGILPVYPLAAGLRQKTLRRIMRDLIREQGGRLLEETLPGELRRRQGLVGLREAIETLHFPPDEAAWRAARKRIVFEELFQLQVKYRKARLEQAFFRKAPVIRAGERTKSFLEKGLPFRLTEDQERALGEILKDLENSVPMRRLLHGEVGSGKTAVALGAAMAAIESGQQVAFMAPTEVLARQLHTRAAGLFSSVGVGCWLLAGKETSRGKGKRLSPAEACVPGLFFGTQALFQEKTEWKNLGLVIIDEQHRFGVSQKAALVRKGNSPHLLVMSATPIPRSLALTAYGELDLTRLNGRIPGRKPVRTCLLEKRDLKGLFRRVREEVASGGQVLWVCPLLEEKVPRKAVPVRERFQCIQKELPDLPSGWIHGKMAPNEKEEAVRRFEDGETKILVSTTVVDVGIDLPGATVIVVENAECFGLSQLHQLRGRVGRGQREGACVLLVPSRSEGTVERLSVFLQTTDGFALAEADLRLRGPGALCGVRQHGVTEFKLADPSRDRILLERARDEAGRLRPEDELLAFSSWVCADPGEALTGIPFLG